MICTSGEGSKNQNKIITQGIPKTHINKLYLSQTLVFVVPHIRTLVISCQNIWLHTDLNHIYKEGGFLLNYINKVKYWRVITILITFGYQNCGKKTGFNAISMFSLSYFALQLLQKIMHHSFAYIFYHFTFFTIPEGDILLITNDDHDKYFSIASLV